MIEKLIVSVGVISMVVLCWIIMTAAGLAVISMAVDVIVDFWEEL